MPQPVFAVTNKLYHHPMMASVHGPVYTGLKAFVWPVVDEAMSPKGDPVY